MKKRHIDDGNYISKLQSLCSDQISASSELVRNMFQNCSVETSFSKWMYFQIVLSLRILQEIRDMWYIKNTWKIFEQIVTVVYLYVILFIIHEKHISREAYLESPQRYMIGFFLRKELVVFKLFTIFSKKVSS